MPVRKENYLYAYYHRYKANGCFHVRYFGKGIYTDIKKRLLKYYVSDIRDGLTYRTIPSTIYIFFTNLLPAIAFAQDMFDHTNNAYGVNEILLASAMGGIVFGVLSGSPLCIVGVTGPVSIFNYTVYQIIEPMKIPYFQFMCWICIWSMGFHFILAFTNSVNFMRFVTKFSCDVFGFFINVVYIQKGIQILTHQFERTDLASAFASIVVALVMMIFGVSSQFFGSKSHYLPPYVRTFIRDYSIPGCVVFFTGFIHFGGYMDEINFMTLPVTTAFYPTDTANRKPDWFIRFWEGIKIGDVFFAIPFAILLTTLFYYDHNISSLICQSSKFPLKKPPSFHYDFFLLGVTTGVSGLIGIPAPNGLIPQAPLHTLSLCIYENDHETGENKITRVVEQRLSNTIQGLLTVAVMTRPFLIVLGLIPQAILAGLFWVMAITALDDTDIVKRIRYMLLNKEWKMKLSGIVINNYKQKLMVTESEHQSSGYSEVGIGFIGSEVSSPHESRDQGVTRGEDDANFTQIIPSEYPVDYYLVKPKYFNIYLLLELVAFAGEYGITCTKGAIGFPGVLMLILFLVPTVFPWIFPKDQLKLLDHEAADELVLENLKINSL